MSDEYVKHVNFPKDGEKSTKPCNAGVFCTNTSCGFRHNILCHFDEPATHDGFSGCTNKNCNKVHNHSKRPLRNSTTPDISTPDISIPDISTLEISTRVSSIPMNSTPMNSTPVNSTPVNSIHVIESTSTVNTSSGDIEYLKHPNFPKDGEKFPIPCRSGVTCCNRTCGYRHNILCFWDASGHDGFSGCTNKNCNKVHNLAKRPSHDTSTTTSTSISETV